MSDTCSYKSLITSTPDKWVYWDMVNWILVSANKLILAQDSLHVFIVLLVLDQMRQRTTGVVWDFQMMTHYQLRAIIILVLIHRNVILRNVLLKALFQNMLTLKCRKFGNKRHITNIHGRNFFFIFSQSFFSFVTALMCNKYTKYVHNWFLSWKYKRLGNL